MRVKLLEILLDRVETFLHLSTPSRAANAGSIRKEDRAPLTLLGSGSSLLEADEVDVLTAEPS